MDAIKSVTGWYRVHHIERSGGRYDVDKALMMIDSERRAAERELDAEKHRLGLVQHACRWNQLAQQFRVRAGITLVREREKDRERERKRE